MRTQSHLILTADPRMRQLLVLAENVAQGRATILITGESGTGKELLARFIHTKSNRNQNPFVAINCAALPDGLLESELFGFEKGAFTGADSRRAGKFELADNGTFLMDEVSELPVLLQSKILRVLQEGEIERLGALKPSKVNVRLIATTNRPLDQMVKSGEFRQDLFYRLNVIPLVIPPLRARPRDVEYLSRIFLQACVEENKTSPKSFSDSAMQKLLSYSWPGNIRELQNLVERTVMMCPKENIEADDLMIEAGDLNPDLGRLEPGMTISEAERRLIFKTLDHTGQNRTRAAEILGISIRTLRNKLSEYRKEGTNESSL